MENLTRRIGAVLNCYIAPRRPEGPRFKRLARKRGDQLKEGESVAGDGVDRDQSWG